MKKLDILIQGALYALYMFLACLVSMTAEALTMKVLSQLILMSDLTVYLIRAVFYTIAVNTILAVAAYSEGYKSANWHPISTGISGVLAVLVHFIFSLLFNFSAFCAGGVKFISALIKFGSGLTMETLETSFTRFDCIAVFFINGLIYCIVMILFQKLGASKRLVDREELSGSRTPNTETTEE